MGWSVERTLTEPSQGGTGPDGYDITFNGKTQTLRAWSRETGIPYGTLKDRLQRGKPLEEALTTPPMKRGKGSPNYKKAEK